MIASSGISPAQDILSVGVLPFNAAGKQKADLDALAGELIASLSRYKFIRLVERANMNAIVREIELGQSGLIDEAVAIKAGRLHGVQCLIIGALQGSRINARAVHTETGRIIAAASSGERAIDELGTRLASGIEVFIARENLRRLRNDSPSISLEFRVEKKGGGGAITGVRTGRLRIGESVVFHFKANRDGYLTIVDIQPGGDVVILYPNDMSPDNGIIAGREYSIPSSEDSFEITVSEPAGKDTVCAFFTEKKIDWLDRKKLSGEGFWSVKEGERAEMTRGLKVVSTKLKSAEWESITLDIDVE